MTDDEESSDDDLGVQIALSDSDGDDDNILGGDFTLLMIYIATYYDNERDTFFSRNRINWDRHVQELVNENAFGRVYRMSLEAFNQLCIYLDPLLLVDEDMSTLRTNKPPIDKTIIISSFIRWVSGGSYHDVRQVARVSVASFYRIMMRCARAIISCDTLAYHFPQTTQEIVEAANNFKSISTNGFIVGCVGVMDGILLRIRVPSSNKWETSGPSTQDIIVVMELIYRRYVTTGAAF
jgi:hypothetical protein